MVNKVHDLEESSAITLANASGSAYAVGKKVRVGNLLAICAVAIANGGSGTALTSGSFVLPKTTGALAVGQVLGYDFTNDRVTTDLNQGVLVMVTKAALSADTTVECSINYGIRPRRCAKVVTADSTAASANYIDVDCGFPTTGCRMSGILFTTADPPVPRLANSIKANPGGSSPNVVRFSWTDVLVNEVAHIEVEEVVGA